MRVLGLLVLCSCSHFDGQDPAPAKPSRVRHAAIGTGVLAVPDETIELRATVRGIVFATVQTAIGEPGWVGGRRAIVVRSRGRADGFASLFGDFTWELSSTIDLDSGLPIEDHEEAVATMAGQHEHHSDRRTWEAGDLHHDIHSAIGAVRAWRSEPGLATELAIEIGGGHFTADLTDVAREPHGGKPAVRYEGRGGGQPFVAWVSDDEARVPLGFHCDTELGAVALELVAYDVRD
ncbi:MAG TPA: hypothetical protein VMJ10_23590 [Kofleriaceae bacterium]|nr:hypothetical protein [Kofleriaceae bacterium]